MTVQLLTDVAFKEDGTSNVLLGQTLADRDVWHSFGLSQANASDPAKQSVQGPGTFDVSCVVHNQVKQGATASVGPPAADTDYLASSVALFCDGVMVEHSQVVGCISNPDMVVARGISVPWRVQITDSGTHVFEVKVKYVVVTAVQTNVRPATIYDRVIVAGSEYGADWLRVDKVA
jgi:hypothetical protein